MAIDVLKQIWPEWQVEGKPLGKGSFGVVYKAVRRDHNVESYAAIKVISIPADPSEMDSLRSEGLDMNATRTYLQGIVNDFVSEIQLMENLKGTPNIVSVEDYKVVEKTDEIGWDIYIRMELLTSFNTYICDKKLTEGEVIKLGCDICTALEVCGQRNIIHRDIKPENIFINDFGYFKLGDFGIARKMENMTGGLSQKGTFNYMAPEVATSSDYDARVDTYSLGIVLYRLLNGNRLPFLDTEKQLLNPNERRNAVDRRLRGEELPAPCDASPAMTELILRACAYDPNIRFASAMEMKQALMSVANGTYQTTGTGNLDRTTSVRRAPAGYDRTISVRRAPAATNQQSGQLANTFGATPKKKNKLPVVLAAVLSVVILVSAGIFVVPRFIGNNVSDNPSVTSGEPAPETADYSPFDDEQIASIISEAEALAADEDYEGALTKIKTGLVTYPKSEALKEKETEYTDALAAQVKEKTLEEAANLAEAGDYVAAIKLIDDAQKNLPDDNDYKSTYEKYANEYTYSVIEDVDAHISDRDINGAISVLNAAIRVLPNSNPLKEKLASVNSLKPVSLSTLKPITGGWSWNEGSPKDSYDNDYSSASNYVILNHVYDYGNDVKFAEYRVDKKYEMITGKIAPHSNFEDDESAYMQIFVDDVLAYTSTDITRKQDAIPFEIDVSSAEYIKLVIDLAGYGANVILSDVVLWPDSGKIQTEATNNVSLTTLKPITGGWSWNEGSPGDPFGTDYSSSKNYAILSHVYDYGEDIKSAEYRLDEKYYKVTGQIAPHTSFEEDESAYLQIYVDDELVYMSETITIKQIPQKFEIDVNNAKFIKFVVNLAGYGSNIIISDVLLWNE